MELSVEDPTLAQHRSDDLARSQMRKLLHQIMQNSTAMPFRRAGNIYKCFFCFNNYNKASELKEHTKTHVDDDQIIRTVKRCGIQTIVNLDITELSCKQCDKEFNDITYFLTHIQEEHREKCDLDGLQYISCYKISDGDMTCLICDQRFEYFYPLMLHTLRVHKERRLKCEQCGLSFGAKDSMVKHYKSVHETNPETFNCRYCAKVFSAQHKRYDHEKRMHNETANKCSICGEILGSTFKKASHMASVHNEMATEFKCENCPRVFRLQNHLVKHNKRVHLKEKTKVCTVCGDKFFENRLLALHMVRHSDEKPFECEICHKKFSRKKGLEIHVRIHTGDKRCVCKECGEAFVQWTSLKLHLRVHHGLEKNPQAN